MTTPRPRWNPADFDAAAKDIAGGIVEESSYLELKSQLSSKDAAAQIRKGLQALANNGGTFVLGVAENDKTGVAERATPVPLNGLVEQILQIAAKLDPQLILPDPRELRDDANDSSTGIVLVEVPPSLWAPHQNKDGQYFMRNGRMSVPMPDAEVERLIRLRGNRETVINESLEKFAAEQRRNRTRDLVPKLLIAAALQPAPRGDTIQKPLMSGDFAKTMRGLLEQAPLMNKDMAKAERTPSGVKVTGQTRRGNRVMERYLEIDRDGAIRFWFDDLSHEHHTAFDGALTIFEWRTLVETTERFVAFANAVADLTGAPLGLSIAVQVVDIRATWPDRVFFDTNKDARAQQTGIYAPVEYESNSYKASTVLNGVQARSDLAPVLEQLYGALLNSYGLPALADMRNYAE